MKQHLELSLVATWQPVHFFQQQANLLVISYLSEPSSPHIVHQLQPPDQHQGQAHIEHIVVILPGGYQCMGNSDQAILAQKQLKLTEDPPSH